MWNKVGLHNGAKGEVVDFIYKDKYMPRSGNLPEAVVAEFFELDDYIETFLS